MYIYNEFGIKPTNTFTSAGSDYYIPNINDTDVDKVTKALTAFIKSYNLEIDDITYIEYCIKKNDTCVNNVKISESNQVTNIIHFFLALGNKELDRLKKIDFNIAIEYFIKNYVVFDKKGNVGIKLKLNDTVFINSGIKVALDSVLSGHSEPNNINTIQKLKSIGIGVAGLYVNKSGKGNAGFDVRACLVDEDYSGFVHLSQAYTKDLFEDGKNIIYAGDKLTQMMLLPIFHTKYIETDESTYNELMANSQRGDSGFGSSDVKH